MNLKNQTASGNLWLQTNDMSDDFSNDYEKRENYDYTTDPYRDAPKKSGCCGGCGCGCLILILALLIGGFLVYRICLQGVPLQVMPETTVITEPLKSDGKNVDFFQVLTKTEPQIPVEENGFRDVVAAYGKPMFEAEFGVARDWQFDETCKKFGLDPALKPTAVYEDPPQQSGAEEDAEKYESALKEWLEKVSPGLDIVQKSGLKEHYFMPMVRRNDKELVLLSISQDVYRFHTRLSQGLRVRAAHQLATGETEKAWKDILASLRIYRQVLAGADSLSNIDGLESNTRLTEELTQNLLRHEHWTPELLTRAVADLETLPKWPSNQELLQMTRFILLDGISATDDMRNVFDAFAPGQANDETVRFANFLGFNWNLVAKSLNAKFDEMEQKLDGKKFEEITTLFGADMETQLETELQTRFGGKPEEILPKLITVGGRSVIAGEFVGTVMSLMVARYIVEEIREEIHCRLLRAGLALERYKFEKKEYPDSLDALALKPLEPAIPIKYEKTGEGYTLSVGEIKIEHKKTIDP